MTGPADPDVVTGWFDQHCHLPDAGAAEVVAAALAAGVVGMIDVGCDVAGSIAAIERANGLLRLFLKNRWIGLWPILYGDQVRQTALDNWIFSGTLDVEHLPESAEVV